ncbi:MAG: hypothetical protein ACE5KU_00530 [Nitrososphaerales archaeon]
MVERDGTVGNGSNLSLDLNILTLKASRSSENHYPNGSLDFKVDAKLEETSRKSGEVMLEFELRISTEPDVATFDIGGQVKVQGESKDIERIITTDPNTQVPILISEIYSRIYSMIYILASGIKVSYPAAGLLYSDNKLPTENITYDQESSAKTVKEEKAEEADSDDESAEAAQQAVG